MRNYMVRCLAHQEKNVVSREGPRRDRRGDTCAHICREKIMDEQRTSTDDYATTRSRLPPEVELKITRQTLSWQTQPLRLLQECAQRYGDAFTLNFGSHGSYAVFSSPAAVRDIFSASNQVLHAGRGNRILKPLLGPQSLLLLEERRHLRERRLLLPGFHAQAIERYTGLIQCAALEVMAEAEANGHMRGEEVAVHSLMQSVAVRVILQAVFGMRHGPRFEELSAQVQSVLNDSKLTLGMLDQLRANLGSATWQAFRRGLNRIDEILLEEVALRRGQGATQADLLGILLGATYDDGTMLDDRALRDELMTLIVTGYETTATALAWALYWLAREPSVLERLITEIAPLGRTPVLSSLVQAKYLRAVCQETLRICPIIPIVAREVQAPIEIQNYSLPAGVTVAAAIYLAHHRPDAFPEPEKFRPERFLQRPPSPFEFIPFGGGVRRCIGMTLALSEMQVVLGSVLARYELAPLAVEVRPVRRFITLAPDGGAKLRLRALPLFV